MVDEYISREAALQAQNKSMNLAECRKRLERIPAADVRPVVLCKHCRWAVFTPYGTAYGCRLLSAKPNYLLGITDDFFCASGDDMREVEHE